MKELSSVQRGLFIWNSYRRWIIRNWMVGALYNAADSEPAPKSTEGGSCDAQHCTRGFDPLERTVRENGHRPSAPRHLLRHPEASVTLQGHPHPRVTRRIRRRARSVQPKACPSPCSMPYSVCPTKPSDASAPSIRSSHWQRGNRRAASHGKHRCRCSGCTLPRWCNA